MRISKYKKHPNEMIDLFLSLLSKNDYVFLSDDFGEVESGLHIDDFRDGQYIYNDIINKIIKLEHAKVCIIHRISIDSSIYMKFIRGDVRSGYFKDIMEQQRIIDRKENFNKLLDV